MTFHGFSNPVLHPDEKGNEMDFLEICQKEDSREKRIMVTYDPLNGVCISDCEGNGVSKLVMFFVEHLIQRKIFMLTMEKSVRPMEAEVFTHAKE